MKTLNTLVTILLTLIGSNTLAQGVFDRGNGGGGIICRDQKNQTIEVLDLRNMNEFGFQLDTAIPSEFNQALQFAFDRFAQSNDDLTVERLQTEWQNFKTEVQFVQHPLDDIRDIGMKPILPERCNFVQLAIQWDETAFAGRNFIITEPLWKKLNGINQAALIMHELLYRMLLRYDDKKFSTSPIVVRRTVGYYFSAQYITPKNPPYHFRYK